MKKIPFILLLFVILSANIALGDTQDITIKKLYAAPTAASKQVYDIPIDVTLLDVSEDCNWFKVKLAFNIGPLQYRYTGWTKIPVGDIVAARMEKLNQTAKAAVVEEN